MKMVWLTWFRQKKFLDFFDFPGKPAKSSLRKNQTKLRRKER